jgi:LmbE family N-acetylglucosaminyl deacetylase
MRFLPAALPRRSAERLRLSDPIDECRGYALDRAPRHSLGANSSKRAAESHRLSALRGGRAANVRRLSLTNVVCVLAVLIAVLTFASSLQSSFPISLPSSHAQGPAPFSTQAAPAIDKIALHQALLDLTNPWTVMCVAAHPDDEDGTSLTILRRKYGVHTVSLFSTYGEGGQNVVGPELYEELGVIRARETMAAAQIQGSEPYFLGLKDFGYSKSADEAFRVWGHDEALRRMVLKIRELRPDVIITHHDTTSGHGHHQATGRLILEAFDAAADPKRFPEQLTQVRTWQPKRLFVRVFSGGQVAEKSESKAPAKIIRFDPNERDLIRGTLYAEQALAALQRHATQGPWPKTIEERLRAQKNTTGKLPLISYRLLREASTVRPLPDQPVTLLDGLESTESVASGAASPTIDGRALTEFVDQPARVLDALIDWRRAQQNSAPFAGDIDRSRLLLTRANQALAIAAGVGLTIEPRDAVLVAGIKTTFSINLSNSGDRSVRIRGLSLEAWRQKTPLNSTQQLGAGTETGVTIDRLTPQNASITVPKEEHLYDGLFMGQPFTGEAELEVDGAKFSLSSKISLAVAPAVEIKTVAPAPYVWTPATLNRGWALNLRVVNHVKSTFRGLVKIRSTDDRIAETGREITLEPHEASDMSVGASASLPRQRRNSRLRSGVVTLSIDAQDSSKPITYRQIQSVYSDARVSAGLRVGYLPSFDQTLKRSLAALGVDSKELSIEDIQKGDLTTLDTIIIDNRGYQAHPELILANKKLLDFVAAGGTLIVFYHKDNEWNPNPDRGRPQLAPYPIILSDDRVTEEIAPIRFLEPRHPLLNYPNKITSADFDNWIQERGLYYPKEWDPHYDALFASNDTGEQPLRGGLLVTRVGRGNYIYTSMVWYRQLAAGVPGAYRMFANLISYGHSQGTAFWFHDYRRVDF